MGELTDVLFKAGRISTWLGLAGVLCAGLVLLARETLRGTLLPNLRPEVAQGLLRTFDRLATRIVLVAVIVIVVAIVAPQIARRLPGHGDVGGLVRDRTGQPIAAAEVAAIGEEARTLTTSSGRFLLRLHRRTGPIHLTVLKDGFRAWDDYANEMPADNIVILTAIAALGTADPSQGPIRPDPGQRPSVSAGPDEEPRAHPVALAELHTALPSERRIRAVLQDFPFDRSRASDLEEARGMLESMGVVQFSISSPSHLSGMLSNGYEVTIWPNTYNRAQCYGVRYGMPAPGRPYFGTNATYFEICK